MKLLSLSLVAVALLGCTHTVVETPALKVRRVSFLQKVEIPRLSIGTNGVVTLSGYKTDGGTEAAAAVVSAAVAAAMKSVAP